MLSASGLVVVDAQPMGLRVQVEAGTTLLEAGQAAGIVGAALCGGKGTCGKCRVRLVTGDLSPLTSAERNLLSETDVSSGFRLACQARALGDVRIYVPPESLATTQRLQVEGLEQEIAPVPAVVPVDVALESPTLRDLRADSSRVKCALTVAGVDDSVIDLPVLSDLSERLRDSDWRVRLVLRGREVVAVLPQDARLLGLAVDVGTTKLAAYLVDLQSGSTLAKLAAPNPQIAYGDDVVSRIGFANDNRDGRRLLQDRLVASLNKLVGDLCARTNSTRAYIVDAVVVGNTAMHHLLAGLPVRQLGEAPYVATVTDAMSIRAQVLGLDLASGAFVHLPPNIAGYVGADHVAMLLATNATRRDDRVVMAVDIGTNTEISLIAGGRHLACSCASGPAFEGAHIQFGMRAAPGAIERVYINGETVHAQTIDDQRAVGICGSGILDAVAEMYRVGILNRAGRVQNSHPCVRDGEHGKELLLVRAEASGNGRDVLVTRSDVNEVQLAKGAIRAGVEVLLDEAGIGWNAIDKFLVAGAFGTYIDVESAVRVGMFPPIPLDRFSQVGNAAGIGAKQMLASTEKWRAATKLAERIDYVELTAYPRFTDIYVDALMF